MTGRPSSFHPEFAEQAEKLCKLGATDTELADFFNVSEKTINTWKKKYQTFFQSIKSGKLIADSNVAASLYQRAIGYSHPDTHFSTLMGAVVETPTIKHYPPDTIAAIFWLKNRRPEQWREKTEREVTVKRSAEDLSDDDLLRIAAGGSDGAAKQKGGEKVATKLH